MRATTQRPGPAELRGLLGRARLMLLFTPELCPAGRDPLEILTAALPHVDVVQVRIKSPDGGPSPARELRDWTRRVLALCPAAVPVFVNDRADVALALQAEGCAGVHLGQDDMPCAAARELLGPDALIGLSTHDARQVVRAQTEPIDYLGFGPVFPTTTKGYAQGHGPEAAWIAQSGSSLPVFPIGGIEGCNVAELAHVGRAAVTAAILGAAAPANAAAMLRAALGGESSPEPRP